MPSFRPKPWRLMLGFLLVPLVSSIALTLPFATDLSSLAGSVLVVAVVGGYPAGLVLGIPAYVLLRRRLRPRAATMAAVGGSIAAAPWSVSSPLVWPTSSEYERIGDCVTIIDGVRTWCGYLAEIKPLAIIFAFGVLGGLTFWLCVAWRGRTGDAARAIAE